MSERNVSGGFATVDRNIPHLELQAKWNGVQTADLGSAPGDAFDLSDQTTANQRLKRIGGGVEEQGCDAEKHDGEKGK